MVNAETSRVCVELRLNVPPAVKFTLEKQLTAFKVCLKRLRYPQIFLVMPNASKDQRSFTKFLKSNSS